MTNGLEPGLNAVDSGMSANRAGACDRKLKPLGSRVVADSGARPVVNGRLLRIFHLVAFTFGLVAHRADVGGIGLLGVLGISAHQDAPEKESKYRDE